MTGLNFDTLGAAPEFESTSINVSGKPLDIPLGDIDPDPDQPRVDFDDGSLQELATNIKDTKVNTPISVRPHPTDPDRWMINLGERRWRASVIAGKQTIPAFIDENLSDYDQMSENDRRTGLSSMERALFIQKRLKAGDKKAEIAKRLLIDKSSITFHLSLIDAPACIETAYREQRLSAPRAAYDLRKLYDKHPEAVEQWCRETETISRTAIDAFAASLARDSASLPAKPTAKPKPKVAPKAKQKHSAPILTVNVGSRPAAVDLSRNPSGPGSMYVRYLDDDSVSEIECSACTVVGLELV